jgi:parallel beta-helix repeat protein
LEEAVERAPEEVPIELGAGTFYLEDPLDIRRPITLVGAGMDEAEIVSEDEYLVRFNGDGPFVVEDITFRHEGRQAADVVVVRDGEITFVRCRFTEAIYDEEEDFGGVGLRLEGDTTGSVQDCEVVENTVGIALADNTAPTLEGNVVTDNEGFGIAYWGRSGGVARGNDCSWNGSGIGVGSRAEPLLEENTCTNNTYDGIWYYGYAGGTASRNECSENGYDGIGAGDLAQPTLEENICQDNDEVGIAFFDESGGVARGNECSGSLYGIYVAATADPDLVDNDCHDNSEANVLDERP